MEFTPPLHTTIVVRKRQLEAEEEELELPEEFQPLAVSTPNVSSYTVPDFDSVHYNRNEAFIVCVCVCVCV